MATLTIRWQRLVDGSGRTCDRCGTTGPSVEAAHQLLKRSLGPLGFEVELQQVAIDPAAFAKNPIESNRIWIGDDSLEDLLGATVGHSRCCSVCGESECRTLTVDGKTHDSLDAPLIVRAGLTAALRKLGGSSPACCLNDGSPDAATRDGQTPCCESAERARRESGA